MTLHTKGVYKVTEEKINYVNKLEEINIGEAMPTANFGKEFDIIIEYHTSIPDCICG